MHSVRGVIPSGTLLALLGAAEHAWDVATGPLELPAPDADLATGAYDLYAVRGVPEGRSPSPERGTFARGSTA